MTGAGIASFLGLVRNHQDGRPVLRLEYSAYGPMVEAETARIVAEAEAHWPAWVAVQHRVGALAIGEVAVAVVAASAHRAPAFEACRYVIEELKRRRPGVEAGVLRRRQRGAGVDPTAAPAPQGADA